MTNNHMRLLTEQEPQSIYGGNIFTSIWNWIKNHFSVHLDRDPQMGSHGEITFTQTFLRATREPACAGSLVA